MEKSEQVERVAAKDIFLLQYQLDTENIKYAKEIQWRIPSLLVALYSAVIAALSFWKQAKLDVQILPAILFMIALGAFGGLGIYLLNGIRKNLKGYRKRQEAISAYSFEDTFHQVAIKPSDYIRNKWIDILFQVAFSIIIVLCWIALLIMMVSLI